MDTHDCLGRREFALRLLVLGSATAAPGWVLGCASTHTAGPREGSDDPTSGASSPAPPTACAASELAPEQAATRAAMRYTDPAPDSEATCGGCNFYTAAAGPDACGSCSILSGAISAGAACLSFARRL